MVLDPDAMWRPESTRPETADSPPTGEPAPQLVRETLTANNAPPAGHVELTLEAVAIPHDSPGPGTPTRANRRGRRRRRWAAAVVATLLALGAAFAVTRDEQPEPAVFEQAEGADPRRLPASADLLWTTTVPLKSGIVGGEPIRLTQYAVIARSAVVAVLPSGDNTSIAIGLDARTGEERWRRPFDFAAKSANLLGALDGTLIVEQNDLDGRRLIGIDIASGTTDWDQPTRDNGVHVILSGTDVVTRVSFTGTERLTFIDPTTGVESARVTGRLIGTDLAGTWYVESGRRIDGINLATGPPTPANIAERTDGWNGPTAVVDGQVIVLDDDGALAIAPTDNAELIPLAITGGELGEVVSFVASGGQNLMAIGDGKVVGLSIVGDTAELRWTRGGSIRAVNVSDRAMLVTLSATATDSDAASDTPELVIIDAVTGEQLGTAANLPGTDDLPRLVGNGFVITELAQLGRQLVGYDLNGNPLWSLPSNDPIQVGNGVIVTVNTGADGYAFAGFGDIT